MKKFSKRAAERLPNAQSQVADLADWLDGLSDRATTYFEGRSEKWQESSAGLNYADWMSQLQQAAEEASALLDTINALEEAPQE